MRRRIKIKTWYSLFTNANTTTKAVNLVTLYRIITAPLLLVLLFKGYYLTFKWLLLVSFLTDAIDGYLARKYKATSVLGSKLDSLGDDLTVLVGTIGIFQLRFDFIKEQLFIILILFSLFSIQLIFSIIKYGKLSSFHTYGAKAAAILQGIFILSTFFFKEPSHLLFYLASLVTALELIEETILVGIIKHWTNDVKGLYWVLKKSRNTSKQSAS